MLLGNVFSSAFKALYGAKRASMSALVVSVIVLNFASALSASAQNSSDDEGDHMKKNDCPPETSRPPQNCEDVRRMAHKLALKRGYMNANGNSIPDVMERPYQIGWNDCSTGNAHMACMFNDECTEQHGTLLGLRSNSAFHATTLYRGKNGQEFECDFTPGSSGIFIRQRADTRVGPAFPDAGESIDPQYEKDGCETNGASSTALNPGGGLFGGGGGSIQDMMMLAAIMQLLQGQQGQQNQSDYQPSPDEVVVPTPTATPTPTPIATAASRSNATKASTAMSDAAIVSLEGISLEGDLSKDDDSILNREIPSVDRSEVVDVSDEIPKAEWEEKREGIF